jgi:asparagine synthetase A
MKQYLYKLIDTRLAQELTFLSRERLEELTISLMKSIVDIAVAEDLRAQQIVKLGKKYKPGSISKICSQKIKGWTNESQTKL